jgi:hypothetical protein
MPAENIGLKNPPRDLGLTGVDHRRLRRGCGDLLYVFRFDWVTQHNVHARRLVAKCSVMNSRYSKSAFPSETGLSPRPSRPSSHHVNSCMAAVGRLAIGRASGDIKTC